MADGDYYADRDEVDNVFGKRNVDSWADIDNQEDPLHISNRIDWANKMSFNYINGRLLNGPYEIPFAIYSTGNTPVLITLISASYAGVFLYDTRRVVNADNPERIAQQRRNADMWLNQIFAGGLKLIDPTTSLEFVKVSKNEPFVVLDDS